MALAAILTWRRVWGEASPNVTFGTNKKLSSKTAAARARALPLAPGCYPDMAPAAILAQGLRLGRGLWP